MEKRFSALFLKPAKEFILSLDKKTQTKLFYIVDKASYKNDQNCSKSNIVKLGI
jgi:hypothetical protein